LSNVSIGLAIRAGRECEMATYMDGPMMMDDSRYFLKRVTRSRDAPHSAPGRACLEGQQCFATLHISLWCRFASGSRFDTRNEIAGHDEIPLPAIGLAVLWVPTRSKQHHMMVKAVQNHIAHIIVIDEIGTHVGFPSGCRNESSWS